MSEFCRALLGINHGLTLGLRSPISGLSLSIRCHAQRFTFVVNYLKREKNV
ncbi:hypothetical protein [Nostoc sp. 106C]|uniref:hypothetical protein n=1 Tax=Nostoc sp. 106C TaxID=1932667 RepID=UPI001AA17D25|nr:hypothetical protein [Nostoc sp. 106C]